MECTITKIGSITLKMKLFNGFEPTCIFSSFSISQEREWPQVTNGVYFKILQEGTVDVLVRLGKHKDGQRHEILAPHSREKVRSLTVVLKKILHSWITQCFNLSYKTKTVHGNLSAISITSQEKYVFHSEDVQEF